MAEVFGGDRPISLCRELTKLHEEVVRTTLGQAVATYTETPPKGEFVLIVAGALTVIHPQVQYLFGKMTMYPSYPSDCRNLLLLFLRLHFPDPDHLVVPIEPLDASGNKAEFSHFFTGTDFAEDYRRLKHFIRDHGYNIPPLVNSYMGLSPRMHVFGTAVNHEFGEVEETGIFIKINEIAEQKKSRHIDTYHSDRQP